MARSFKQSPEFILFSYQKKKHQTTEKEKKYKNSPKEKRNHARL